MHLKGRISYDVWGYNFSWDGMVLMLLGMAFSIAFLVVLIWAFISRLPRKASVAVPPSPASTSFSQSALDILLQRYARAN